MEKRKDTPMPQSQSSSCKNILSTIYLMHLMHMQETISIRTVFPYFSPIVCSYSPFAKTCGRTNLNNHQPEPYYILNIYETLHGGFTFRSLHMHVNICTYYLYIHSGQKHGPYTKSKLKPPLKSEPASQLILFNNS